MSTYNNIFGGDSILGEFPNEAAALAEIIAKQWDIPAIPGGIEYFDTTEQRMKYWDTLTLSWITYPAGGGGGTTENKRIAVPCSGQDTSGYASTYSSQQGIDCARIDLKYSWFNFFVPDDFTSLSSIYVILTSLSTESNVTLRIRASWATNNEYYYFHTVSTDVPVSLTANRYYNYDLTSLITPLTALDIVCLSVEALSDWAGIGRAVCAMLEYN